MHFYWTSLSDQTPLSDCCVLLLDISVRSNTSVRLLWHFYGTSVRSNTSVRLLCTVIGHLSDQTPPDCCALLFAVCVSDRVSLSVRLQCVFVGLCLSVCNPVLIGHLCLFAVGYWSNISENVNICRPDNNYNKRSQHGGVNSASNSFSVCRSRFHSACDDVASASLSIFSFSSRNPLLVIIFVLKMVVVLFITVLTTCRS